MNEEDKRVAKANRQRKQKGPPGQVNEVVRGSNGSDNETMGKWSARGAGQTGSSLIAVIFKPRGMGSQ